MTADGSVIIAIDADGKLAIKEIENTGKEIEGLGTKSKKANEGLTKLAAGASAVAAALIAIGAKSVDAATKFEAAFARTQTIMDATEVSVESMQSSVMKLSQETGMAATDVSNAVYNAISGSVATKDAASFVDQANKLSVAGFTSLSNATDIMTTSLNAYGLSADKIGGISNVLIQTQNLGKTTVDELSGSMGRAISTASAYGVNLQNLSTAYVELTRSGIRTEMATTYLSGMFNELGDTSSAVGKIIAQETGNSFGQLMAQGWSLGDVLQVLSNSVNGNAEAMMGLWGSQEAGKAANAIMTQSVEDFNVVLEQMNAEMAGATGTTESAYETMTETSEFIDTKLQNAFTNLGIAIGSDLNPALDAIKSGFTDVIDGITDFVNENPAVTAALAGLIVGIGVVAVALAGYTIATKVATAATAAFTAVLNTNPIFLAITAITALTAAMFAFLAVENSATEETDELTAASKEQKKEIEKLRAEYDAVCESEGENSAAAVELKHRIDEATEAFEDSKQTVEEYRQAHEKLSEELHQKKDAYDQSTKSLEEEYAGTVNLIERLNDLTAAEEQSAAAKEEISTIVDILNGKYPDLALTYDKLTGILSMSPEDIAAAAAADYRSNKANTDYRRLGEVEYILLPEAKDAVEIARKQKAEAYAEYDYHDYENPYDIPELQDYMKNKLSDKNPFKTKTEEDIYWEDQLKAKAAYDTAVADFEKASSDYSGLVQERGDLLNGLSDMYQEEAASTEGVDGAISKMRSELDALTESYIASYEAAKESMQGQYALWDEVAKVSAKSVGDVTANQQAQAEYWTNYKTNIDTLLSYSGEIDGLSEMVASFGDGSADSVNMIAGMAESLASGDTAELKGLVAAWQENQAAIDAAASSLGDLESGYSDTVDVITEEFDAVLEGMGIAAEARAEAEAAISSYSQAILDGKDEAVSAAVELANAVSSALNTTITVTVSGNGGATGDQIPGNATGTINAKRGLAMVGEHGPELVFMSGGERVITANETRRMLAESYPIAPDMKMMDGSTPAAVGRTGGAHISAIIAVPLTIDGREFARATAEYIGEEMEFEVM